jgi:hypothetical protein
MVYLQDLPQFSGYLHPCEHLLEVFRDDGFEATNTRYREKGVEGISTSAV